MIKSTKNLNKNNKQSSIDKVSIVIPVYNGSNYVKKAINSALAQTYKNIEIIVVNDGSNDGGKTRKICKSYGNKIRYFEKKNGGVSTALNFAISKMEGKYFSWLSHDDIYLPEKIERQMEEIKKYDEKTILYSNFDLINEKDEITLKVYRDHDLAEKKPYYSVVKGLISGITLLIPKKAFEEAGLFNIEHRCVQDYELWFKMLLKGYNFHHMEDILAQSRVHPKQQGNYSPNMATEGDWLWEFMLINMPLSLKEQYEGNEYLFNIGMLEYLKHTPYKRIYKQIEEQVEKVFKESEKCLENKIILIVVEDNKFDSDLDLTIENLKSQTKKVEIIVKSQKQYKDYKTIDLTKKEIIKTAKADYICFVKSGDSFSNEWIYQQLINLLISKKGYVFSDYNCEIGESKIDNIKLVSKIYFDTVIFDLKKIKNIKFENELQFLYDINKKFGSAATEKQYFINNIEKTNNIVNSINLLELYLKDDERDLKKIAELSYDLAVQYNKEVKDNKRVEMYYPCKKLEELNYSRSYRLFKKYLDIKKEIINKLRR